MARGSGMRAASMGCVAVPQTPCEKREMCGSATFLVQNTRDEWQCHNSRARCSKCMAVPRSSCLPRKTQRLGFRNTCRCGAVLACNADSRRGKAAYGRRAHRVRRTRDAPGRPHRPWHRGRRHDSRICDHRARDGSDGARKPQHESPRDCGAWPSDDGGADDGRHVQGARRSW